MAETNGHFQGSLHTQEEPAVEDPFLSPKKPISTDSSPGLEVPRPLSKSSRRSDISGTTDGQRGDDGTTGIIIIGMDNTDAATMGRTETTSRRSSREMDPRRPSDTTDTEPDDPEHDNSNKREPNTQNENPHPPHPLPPARSQRSNSSSSRAAIPVMLVDRRRSTSSSGSSTRSSTSSNHNSLDSPTSRPRQTSSTEPPDTEPTTITSSSANPARPSSATEFQKFRHQLHSVPSNPAFRPEPEEWQLHPNPHHPKTKTEILRIERTYTPIALPTKARVSAITNYDVLIPRFSPTFPPILREYGISEGEWSGFVGRVNRFCMEAFDPFRLSNVLVNVVAVLSCWLSEWIMPNLTKRKLIELENYIDEVNRGPWREKGVQVISMRRTAYLNIDIEVQTSLLNDSKNTQPAENVGTWERGTHASDPTSASTQAARPETGANSRTSLMEERHGSAGAV